MSTQLITLPISGMTCASCVSHVETALKEVPGVARTTVNLATEKATVQLTDTNVPISRLVAAVQDVGYDVPTDTTTLTIKGMTCASCVDHVETALKDLRGVNAAVVNLGLGTRDIYPGHRHDRPDETSCERRRLRSQRAVKGRRCARSGTASARR